jgi:hypothetical protein
MVKTPAIGVKTAIGGAHEIDDARCQLGTSRSGVRDVKEFLRKAVEIMDRSR